MDQEHIPLPEKPILTGKRFLQELGARILIDPTAFSLLLSNLIVVVLAITEKWQLSTLLMVYLVQSVIIGVFQTIKILTVKEFSTEGFKINGKAVLPTRETQVHTAVSFLLIYGFFHALYLAFVFGVFAGANDTPIEYSHVWSSAGFFLAHHLYSFFRHRAERSTPQNIGTMMFTPFLRILPMHLTIIFGGFLTMAFGLNILALLFFTLLKTIADLLFHLVEHFPWDQFTHDIEGRYRITKAHSPLPASALPASADQTTPRTHSQ